MGPKSAMECKQVLTSYFVKHRWMSPGVDHGCVHASIACCLRFMHRFSEPLLTLTCHGVFMHMEGGKGASANAFEWRVG